MILELIGLIISAIIALVYYLCTGKKTGGGSKYNYTRNATLTLDQIKGSIPYLDGTGANPKVIHIGQRKLFLNELKFILEHVDSGRGKKYIVYAGAAPANHTGFLMDLVNTDNRDIIFILVDPNPFDVHGHTPQYLQSRKPDSFGQYTVSDATGWIKQAISGSEKMYLINDFFTDNLAEAIARELPECFFVSDIRTNSHDEEHVPDAADILWNMSQQYNWITVMKPAMSMLKFRHPFYAESDEYFYKHSKSPIVADSFARSKKNGIDFVKNYSKRQLEYFDGTVDLQPWPGEKSTETRLITNGKKIKNWGTPEKYESVLFYYNKIERPAYHKNPNADYSIGFDLCNDCAIENYIWTEYSKKFPQGFKKYGPRVRDLVLKLSKNTHRSLIRQCHGLDPNKRL